jgi:hypothetical protein
VQFGKGPLLRLELTQQPPERLFRLQVAQSLGVRRGNVDGDVGGASVHGAQAGEIVVRGPRIRRVEVLADVEAQDAGPLRAGRIGEEPLDAIVVEAEPVDERFGLRQPEEARLRIAGLRSRRDGAALDEAEPERGESVDVRGVLVESGGEPDRWGTPAIAVTATAQDGAIACTIPKRAATSRLANAMSCAVSGSSVKSSGRKNG